MQSTLANKHLKVLDSCVVLPSYMVLDFFNIFCCFRLQDQYVLLYKLVTEHYLFGSTDTVAQDFNDVYEKFEK